ncbi:hypothetical protein SDC9_179468 [bioreactor metagenome]|uniref:Uncharacterized protein n=1 Tax=bioreactor metagenome TaxID=1076179 RepID=A0A645H878_9ZZZZ
MVFFQHVQKAQFGSGQPASLIDYHLQDVAQVQMACNDLLNVQQRLNFIGVPLSVARQ